MAISVRTNTVKTYAIWLIVLGFLAFAGWQGFQYINYRQYPRVPLTVGGVTFDVRVATTDATRERGLSGTKELARTEGMLFVFDSDDTWGIWMKDMTIPIDILWLDKNKKIIYMVKEAQPSSYPYTTFKPSKPARYVVELAAGSIEQKRLKITDEATFDISGIEEANGV